MAISISENVYTAEDQLSRGLLEDAYSNAMSAIKSVQDPQMLARGCSVLIQADFQCSKLTELEAILHQCGHKLRQLPVPTILLWAVVAVELNETTAARTTLERYLSDISTVGVSLAREDAMALSRLYAVQLLGSLCHDFAAAATWVEAGGAGLSEEQQQLLLLELEEAEEVMQEERLAEWAATAADTYHDASPLAAAAAAAAGDLASHPKAVASVVPAAAADGRAVDPLGPASPLLSPGIDDAGSVCISDLGPSASGAGLSGALSGGSAWGVDRMDSVDRADSGLLSHTASLNPVSTPATAAAARGVGGNHVGVASGEQRANGIPAAAAAAAVPMGGLCNGQSCWNAAVDQIVLGQGTELSHQEFLHQPLAAAAAPAAAGNQSAHLIMPLPAAAGRAAAAADRAAAREVDRLSNAASPASLYAWAAPGSSHHTRQQQQQHGGPHETLQQLDNSSDTSAAVAATPHVAADGLPGTIGVSHRQDYDQMQSTTNQQQQQQEQQQFHVAASGLPDSNAFCTMTGLLNDDDVSTPDHTADLPAADLRSSIPDSSSSSSNSSRDQQDTSRHDKPAVGAGNAADSSTGQLSAAAAGHAVQQQQQSLTEWVSSKASSAWQSQQVQATLKALNLQDLEPWEIAGGAGALLLLGYGMYRKRRTIRRAAADLASGVAQTAQMALGMAINPMAAVPGTGHLSRP